MATQVSLSPEIARRIPGEVNAVYNAMVQVRRHLHANPELGYEDKPSIISTFTIRRTKSLKLQISPKLKDVMRVTSRNPNPQTNPSTIGELLLCPTILRLTNCRAIPISRARFMAFRDSGFVGSQFGSSSLYIIIVLWYSIYNLREAS
ncbi:hypothetical protein SeMB42_g05998 [Synchytrium endobioticum]|uniref:Uncharacterized protein n=1 Tax=Synchytrium endobioticum TaxID=286115 RepID=A0A507CMW5_9FUNG|nr:hypothetical protein SeMB42_g05998 [Synchytrium endobioticum]